MVTIAASDGEEDGAEGYGGKGICQEMEIMSCEAKVHTWREGDEKSAKAKVYATCFSFRWLRRNRVHGRFQDRQSYY